MFQLSRFDDDAVPTVGQPPGGGENKDCFNGVSTSKSGA